MNYYDYVARKAQPPTDSDVIEPDDSLKRTGIDVLAHEATDEALAQFRRLLEEGL
jgi:hypothetical protein